MKIDRKSVQNIAKSLGKKLDKIKKEEERLRVYKYI